MSVRLIQLPVFVLLVCSCDVPNKLETSLRIQTDELKIQNAKILNQIEKDPVTKIDWESALGLLNERSLLLNSARKRVENAKRVQDEQWKTWLPNLTAYSNIQTSLSELGSLSLSSVNFSVFAPLRIPNPLTERATAFQNSLTYLQAVDSLEVSYRQEVRRLYGLFSEEESLGLGSSGSGKDVRSIEEGLSLFNGTIERASRLKTLQGRMASMLNLPGKNLLPIGSSRPEIDYSGQLDRLIVGENYGQLAARLYAFNIQGAILREKGIKLNKWPAISISSSTPALYDSRVEGDNNYLDADRIGLFGGLSKSYDFTGRAARSIESAEENTELVRKNLLLQMDQEARQWVRLQSAYRKILMERKIAEERLERLKKNDFTGSASANLLAFRSAKKRLESSMLAKERLDLEIWIWDGSCWKN